MNSILTSIKKLLGPDSGITVFDPDIIFHINMVFATLTQLGCGPSTGFFIEDATTTWSSYTSDTVLLGLVREYVFISVKLMFDPPLNASVLQAFQAKANELESRIVYYVDTGSTT